MARIAIVGVGAIGSVIAALLEQTGRHEVTLCVRRLLPELIVEYGDKSQVVHARRLLSPAEAGPVDWVLVATKAYDAPGAAAWLAPLCASGAPLAVLQNGVEHRERFAPYLPVDRIVPVVVDAPVERVSAGRILQRATMKLKAPDDILGREFIALFAGSATEGENPADFVSAVWHKLVINAVGVISGLAMRPTGVFADAAIGEVALALGREGIAVGRAEGAKIEAGFAEAVLARYRASPPDSINSLYADRIAGRPTEIDARNGVIVRLGRKHGIPTPCNAMAVALLQAM